MAIRTFYPARARLHNGQMVFEEGDLASALRQGCFALRIPDDIQLWPGLKLAREFYLPVYEGNPDEQSFRGFRERSGVFFDREHFQTEHILIDGPRRLLEFPVTANRLCDQMFVLGRLLLRTILAHASIPQDLWPRATDFCATDGGVEWFAVSHYRPDRDMPGAPAHKDTGFITVLYYDQPGLEAYIDREWQSIPPVNGHFLINFGGALEVLTARCPDPVMAVLHRVRQCDPDPSGDRFSFAAFLNPAADGDVFQASSDGREIHSLGSVETFLRRFNASTWKDDHADFGISRGTADHRSKAEAQP